MTRFHYKIRRLCAILVGVVFFTSGVLKIEDPVGASLIVQEYLKFFHVGFMSFASTIIAETMSFLEALTGAALVVGVYRKLSSIVASALIVFFTILTFILWVFNPSMECGCFGEAIHMTHLQTLLKNVALCLLGVIAFIPFHSYGRPRKVKAVPFYLVVAGVVVLAGYSLMNIPLVDFTPFAPSSVLSTDAEASEFNEDDYVTTFVYEKHGQEGVFTLDRLPDSTWTFVRSEVVEKFDKRGKSESPVLSFTDSEGEYQDSLALEDLVMVISAYKPEKLSKKDWTKVAGFVSDAEKAGFKAIVLLSAAPGFVPSGVSPSSVFYADFRTLISLNRSNGGVTYFDDGTLIRKWAFRGYPDSVKLSKVFKKDSTDVMLSTSTKGRLTAQAFLLYSFLVMFLL